MVQLSHPYMTTGKTIALTIWTFVSKVISLLFNMLSRFVIAFLPRSKGLLISWLQSPSGVILEPKKIKSDTVSTSICHEVMGPNGMILVFWMLSFKPAISLSSFTFIKRLFSSSSLWTVVLEKTLESPLDCEEIKPVNPKGNQSWIFIGRTDTVAEAPILWSPDMKNWLIWKDLDAGKDWRQEEKGMTEDEMVRWHNWLMDVEFEQAPGVGDGQGSLVCCIPWGRKESDTTEWKGANFTILCPICFIHIWGSWDEAEEFGPIQLTPPSMPFKSPLHLYTPPLLISFPPASEVRASPYLKRTPINCCMTNSTLHSLKTH